MREFELLPSEEQMREMARAFQGVKVRRDIMDGCLASRHTDRGEHRPESHIRGEHRPEAHICGEHVAEAHICGEHTISGDCKTCDDSSNSPCKTCDDSSKSPCSSNRPCKSCDDSSNRPCKSCETACEDSKPLPCQNNKAAIACIAKTYYLQRDLLQAMKRLYSVAPQCYRETIADLIKMKRQNTEGLLNIYMQLVGGQLPYAPNLYNGRDFCCTLSEICLMQEKVLSNLVDLEECSQLLWITSREIVVATALNRMSIFCLFNKQR